MTHWTRRTLGRQLPHSEGAVGRRSHSQSSLASHRKSSFEPCSRILTQENPSVKILLNGGPVMLGKEKELARVLHHVLYVSFRSLLVRHHRSPSSCFPGFLPNIGEEGELFIYRGLEKLTNSVMYSTDIC